MNPSVTIAFVLLLLAGCGGGRSGTAEGLTGVLNAGQSEEAARCQAALLNESEMSDEGVMKVAFGVGTNTAMDDQFDLEEIASDLSDDDQRAFREIADEFAECLDRR